MTSKKSVSPFFSGTFSSNGDSSSADEEDDDVFLNARLDVISRACDDMDDEGLEYYEHPNSSCLLNFKNNGNSEYSLFTPSPKPEDSAIIFSVHLYGKYYGDVGLFEPDISVLDWREFKVYMFSSVNLDSFYSYIISYYDKEGCKSLLESEENYQEILRIAKYKAHIDEKLSLYITRTGGGLTNSIRSLVSSSLRRVNSVGGGTKANVTTNQPAKKDVTTSTSFQNIGQLLSKTTDLNNEDISRSFVPSPHLEELSSPQENYFGDNYQSYSPFDKNYYPCQKHCVMKEPVPPILAANPPITNRNLNTSLAHQDSESSVEVPPWFSSYMKQFKEELSLEVSSKIEERFDEAVGNLSATDVETKLRGLLTGYSSELQNKVLCCCKSPNGHCQKSDSINQSSVFNNICRQETFERRLGTPQSVARLDQNQREDSVEGADGVNNQIYFLEKLLRREEEILDFLDSTNEKIKQRMRVNSDYNYVFEGAEILRRIESLQHRQNRTTNDIRMLQQKKEFDATFVKDENLVDGSLVEPGQKFTKRWAFRNTGLKAWDKETYLICKSSDMKPYRESIPCPFLFPGEEGVISADFTAPSTPGTFNSQWRFMHGQDLFGDHLWCQVKVSPKEDSCDSGKPSSLSSLQSQAQSLHEMARETNFIIPMDLIPHMFSKTSIEYFCYMNKDNLARLSSEEILYYLLYIVRIAKPDLTTLPDRRPLDFLCKYLNRGNDSDFDHLSSFMDKHFFENCFRDSFKEKEIIQCYEELFTTKDSDTLLSRIKQFQNRIINNSCSYSAMSSDSEDEEEDLEEEKRNEEEDIIEDNNKENSKELLEINGRRTGPLLVYEPPEDLLNGESLFAENIIPTPSDFSDFDNHDYESEYDQLGEEVVENEVSASQPNLTVELLNLEDVDSDFDIKLTNHISLPEPENHLPDEIESLADTEDERHSERINESENEDDGCKVDYCSSCDMSDSDSLSDSDSCVESDENDNDDAHHNDEDDGIEVDDNELEHDVAQNDDQDHDSDEDLLNHDDGTEHDSSDNNNDEDNDGDDDHEIEENCLSNNHAKADGEDLAVAEIKSDMEDNTTRVESEKESESPITVESKGKEAAAASPVQGAELKKNITTLRENFSQNVEVQLDFEVISRAPQQGEADGSVLNSYTSDPLTFQEKHFTVSTRLPPDPVQVPDSDDESFDGLVFIKDCDIPSSVPPTEPCSPSNPLPPKNKPSELNESLSCSSFSEFDDDDAEDEAVHESRPENHESSSMMNSFTKMLGL